MALFLGFLVFALAVWAVLAAVVAGLAVAFAADPTFWPAFWLALVVMIVLSSTTAARVQFRSYSRRK
ncbi:membrane protein [Microbacterium phage Lahqtemish]|uniref:membrane protein n=1 Tax=Microbacterium phage Lahqtemish TaxID=2776867 RepID=UPI0018A4852D|nr:membrane protein [Microbacterium phage Lahqtemish]QOP66653.1 membrane protein [Microbacterium phage Lahqtemish]